MTNDERNGRRKVPVRDKRRHTADRDAAATPASERGPAEESPPAGAEAVEHDYLEDLQRLQAEFDNYRKRMMRDQVDIAARSKAQLVERLLPVIDNFERAISHGEGGEGVRLVLKELEGVLAAEGIEEIVAEGRPFDPRIHEAVDSIEDTEVSQPIVTAVHRRGWRMGDRVIRPAMVRVARPAEAVVEAATLDDDGVEG